MPAVPGANTTGRPGQATFINAALVVRYTTILAGKGMNLQQLAVHHASAALCPALHHAQQQEGGAGGDLMLHQGRLEHDATELIVSQSSPELCVGHPNT